MKKVKGVLAKMGLTKVGLTRVGKTRVGKIRMDKASLSHCRDRSPQCGRIGQ